MLRCEDNPSNRLSMKQLINHIVYYYVNTLENSPLKKLVQEKISVGLPLSSPYCGIFPNSLTDYSFDFQLLITIIRLFFLRIKKEYPTKNYINNLEELPLSTLHLEFTAGELHELGYPVKNETGKYIKKVANIYNCLQFFTKMFIVYMGKIQLSDKEKLPTYRIF